jgi:hypothetical protein
MAGRLLKRKKITASSYWYVDLYMPNSSPFSFIDYILAHSSHLGMLVAGLQLQCRVSCDTFEGRSHMEAPGSADSDNFSKINDKLLFIMKPIPTAQ